MRSSRPPSVVRPVVGFPRERQPAPAGGRNLGTALQTCQAEPPSLAALCRSAACSHRHRLLSATETSRGDAALDHRDAIEPVHAGHGQRVVGDDEEAGAGGARDLRASGRRSGRHWRRPSGASTSSRTHERRGLGEEEGEDQGERGQGLLAAGEQRDAGQLLAGRAGLELEPGPRAGRRPRSGADARGRRRRGATNSRRKWPSTASNAAAAARGPRG